MSKVLTVEYLQAHKSNDSEHYLEAGKLLSDAIIEDAIAVVRSKGESERVLLTPKIELTTHEEKGCVTVTYTRQDGSVLTYHRPT